MSDLTELNSLVSRCMLKDRFRLRQQLRRLERFRADKQRDKKLVRLQSEIDSSIEICLSRHKNLPDPVIQHDLPISDHVSEIATAIQERQVVVIAGQTGSGKSTQIPQICLQAGFGATGMIGHTQPRRIAARSIAGRIADELKIPLGKQVGYKIRFNDKTDNQTYIKLMTDGILLAESQHDRFLEQYEVVILDEAHERSLNVDFLLGYLHGLLKRRRDLRLIITSATLDAERFAAHFTDASGAAPVVEVSGRSYPVEVRYRPMVTADDVDINEDRDINDAIVDAVSELADDNRGDTLVFLPTERDIRSAAKRLRAEFQNHADKNTQILPLYARLSAAEQNKIFQVGKHRRIVLATNVAESSLTVPGIRNVVDTGTARISRYSPRLKVQRLPIEAVSRASADQRKGRCGRTSPGICIRLYAEEDFESRDAYTTPEIRRTNLASVILQAKSLKIGAVEEIPFLDPPRPDAIRDGYKTLFELGAVDDNRDLTKLGVQLARMPVDPRIARMIVAGHQEGCLSEILIIAAALEIQDPRERPHDKQQAADSNHEKFLDEKSDFLSFLKLWKFFHDLREKLSRSKLKKACQQNFLSPARMHEWLEIHRQLQDIVRQNRMKITSKKDDYAAIHRALLAGLLSGVAYRSGDHEYTGAGGVKFFLWPGSGLFQKKPQWIIASELVETSKRYARNIAKISPDWIEPLAEHLLKRSYSEPHWHLKSETVMAFEKVSLFGLPIVPKRRSRYGSNDLETARKIFIQQALVDQKLRSFFPFMKHNGKILEEVKVLADKTRRRELIVDEYSIYALYDQRLPDDVYDAASLRRWLKPAKNERNNRLKFQIEDFQAESFDRYKDLYPDRINLGSIETALEYQFAPGADDDGVTLTVPIEGLNQVSTASTGWLVPGLVEEKVLALIRSLPKSIRRNLVPAPETARKVTQSLNYGQGDFMSSVAQQLSQIAEEPILTSNFRMDQIPNHLHMNVRVIDCDGQVLASGRDFDEIRSQLGTEQKIETIELKNDDWFQDGLRAWDFGEIPDEVVIDRGGISISMYPGLIDQGDAIGLRLFDSPENCKRQMRFGLMRLVSIAKRKLLKSQVRWLPGWENTKIYAMSVINANDLEQQVQDLIALVAIGMLKSQPKSAVDFQDFIAKSPELIAAATQAATSLIGELFAGYHGARLAHDQIKKSKWQHAVADISHQLKALTLDGFLTQTPFHWLQQFPRYFNAIEYRIDKLKSGGQSRDHSGTEELKMHWERFSAMQQEHQTIGRFDPKLEEYRWMIEELRVSLFAQPLGTSIKISPQRLEKQWKLVQG